MSGCRDDGEVAHMGIDLARADEDRLLTKTGCRRTARAATSMAGISGFTTRMPATRSVQRTSGWIPFGVWARTHSRKARDYPFSGSAAVPAGADFGSSALAGITGLAPARCEADPRSRELPLLAGTHTRSRTVRPGARQHSVEPTLPGQKILLVESRRPPASRAPRWSGSSTLSV